MMKYYCQLPWTHFAVRPNGDVLPCCRYRGKILGNVNDNFNFLKNENIVKIRELTLGDKEIPGCNKCYFQEKNNIKSMRQMYSDFNNIVTKPKLKYLEIAFSNHCNLKCRMCNSYFSSKWVDDEIKLGIQNKYQKLLNNNFDFDINELDHIKVLGGEPLLNKDFKNKCLEITSKNKLRLEIITNGTFDIPDEIKHIAPNLKQLSICVSVDALNGLNDYIRSGSNFDIIDKNIKKYSLFLRENNFETLTIHMCVLIYNVNLIPTIYDTLLNNYQIRQISIDIINNPKELAISNLPEDIKNQITQMYNQILINEPTNSRKYHLFTKILKYLNQPRQIDFNQVITYHNNLNNIRNEKLNDLNPLISDILE